MTINFVEYFPTIRCWIAKCSLNKTFQNVIHFLQEDSLFNPIFDQLCKKVHETRMHSSRMRTARSLTVSCCILCTPPGNYACPPQLCMPPTAMHAPYNHTCPPQPCTPPCNHTHPPQPHTSPGNHACPPATTPPRATMHAPWQPHMPPGNHACPLPPRGQTDTCKNITFANFVCGR